MSDTGQRVLESASEIFAEKGFSDSTLAEICDRAEANVASANYYFKTKENQFCSLVEVRRITSSCWRTSKTTSTKWLQ